MANTGDLLFGIFSKKQMNSVTPVHSIISVCLIIKVVTDLTRPNETELYILRTGDSLNNGFVFQLWKEFRV